MVVWGRGLMQSHDDFEIARDLSEMCQCRLLFPRGKEREETIKKLNDGLLSQKFEKIFAADFQPRSRHHKRERVAIIFGMLAMELGCIIEGSHLLSLQILRPFLPTIEQQLQLVTALEEYKNNGTPWESGSKCFVDAQCSKARGRSPFDLGDEFWFSGLGHSSDEHPVSAMVNKVCLNCGADDVELQKCNRCKTAQYCSKECQRADWSIHKQVCEARDSTRICPVPTLEDINRYKLARESESAPPSASTPPSEGEQKGEN
ncbi:hypothetical protein F5Y13DRAFT_155659 [Hypoxylon sp. FL1857]|nr:hypothetical protein F5Y13DRAFT_155659 [Hypoxylon sp. FL1857]